MFTSGHVGELASGVR